VNTDDPMGRTVLMVYWEPAPYVLDLVDRLCLEEAIRIKVLFLRINKSQDWNLELPECSEVLPLRVHEAVCRVVKVIKLERPSVIHLAGWGHQALMLTMLLGWMFRIPVVVESDTPRLPVTSWWRERVKDIFYPMLFKIPRFFLPGGTRQSAYLADYSVPEDRIVIAQMTVDTKRITSFVESVDSVERAEIRKAMKLEDEAVVFLYVGRLVPQKGIEILVRASIDLVRTSDELIQVLVVGDGHCLADLRRRSEAWNWLVLTGRLSGVDLLQAFVAADVLVLPSLSESWGLVINEAMAAGLPVIVSENVGCIDDLVIAEKTGFTVAPGCDDSLRTAMAFVARRSELRRQMGRNCLEHIKNWSIEDEAAIITGVWNKIRR